MAYLPYAEPVFAVAPSAVWKVKGTLLILSVIVYFFINRSRREKLIARLELDPRIGAPFTGATHEFPLPAANNPWDSAWLWAGIIAALAGFVLAVTVDGGIGWLLLSAVGLLLAFYDYNVGIGREVAHPVAEAIFHPDHLILVERSGQREVYVFGPSVAFTVAVREITESTTFGADEFKGFAFFVTVKEGIRSSELPLEFDGAGELLARCLHAKSPVAFAAACPDWFVAKMKALPSWQPGYFDELPTASASVVEMTCQGCGGAALYLSPAPGQACQYCGSPKLGHSRRA